MSEKEQAVRLLDRIPEYKLRYVISFLQGAAIPDADPFYSESNLAHIDRGIAALEAGLGVEHDLIEADA